MFTFKKHERISSRTLINSLLSSKNNFFSYPFKVFFLESAELQYNRIMIAVPKKRLKRAVDRNLIKRRIRESYRVLNRLPEYKLNNSHFDFVLIYSTDSILKLTEINDRVKDVLSKIYRYNEKRVIPPADNIG